MIDIITAAALDVITTTSPNIITSLVNDSIIKGVDNFITRLFTIRQLEVQNKANLYMWFGFHRLVPMTDNKINRCSAINSFNFYTILLKFLPILITLKMLILLQITHLM